MDGYTLFLPRLGNPWIFWNWCNKKYGRLYFIFAQMGNSSDLLKTKLERLVLRNTEFLALSWVSRRAMSWVSRRAMSWVSRRPMSDFATHCKFRRASGHCPGACFGSRMVVTGSPEAHLKQNFDTKHSDTSRLPESPHLTLKSRK